MDGADPHAPTREDAGTLSAWADLIRERFTALSITPRDPDAVSGSVLSRQIGPLQASSVRSTPQTFTRTAASAAADDDGLLAVGLVEHGTGHLEQDGRTCSVAAGEFALYDTTRPFTWALGDAWTLRVFTWPLASLPYTDTDTQRLTARTITRDSGVGSLLTPMLSRLAGGATADLAPATAVRLAAEVAEMAVLAASDAGHDDTAGRHDRDLLERAQRHIEEHLDDPCLGPETIAAELYVSVRTLHRLFAHQDLTVAAWIKHRRLEACRRALAAPATQDVPIKDIAQRYGFCAAPLFSREFTHRYGETPRDWRRRHRRP